MSRLYLCATQGTFCEVVGGASLGQFNGRLAVFHSQTHCEFGSDTGCWNVTMILGAMKVLDVASEIRILHEAENYLLAKLMAAAPCYLVALIIIMGEHLAGYQGQLSGQTGVHGSSLVRGCRQSCDHITSRPHAN